MVAAEGGGSRKGTSTKERKSRKEDGASSVGVSRPKGGEEGQEGRGRPTEREGKR